MESLGKLLKEARLKANVSLGQIAKETKIAKKYLEALENEEYSVFPGETYLKGFLKSYCEFLKLNSREMLGIYEKIKIAETPTPMDQLIPKPKLNLRPFFVVFSMVVILCVIVAGGIFGYMKLSTYLKNRDTSGKITKKSKKRGKIGGPSIYKMKDADQEKIFDLKKGDIVEYSIESQKYELKIKELSPIVVVDDPKGDEVFLIKSYRRRIDLNNDEEFDLVLNLNFWDSEKANISFIPFKDDLKMAMELEDLKPIKGDNPEIIVRKSKLEKIALSIDVKESTFLRYKIDDQEEIEKIYNNNEINDLTANNRIMIWLSNAGLVSLNFKEYNKQHNLGNVGEIAVKIIQWIELNNGEYELQVSSLK
jgi:cytoskeleton protein RodZ